MGKQLTVSLLTLALLSLPLSGCFYFSARNEMKGAERLLAELKAAGGEKSVPYEYCSAEAFLEAARLEYEHNDFKKSREFSSRSKSAAQSGLTEIKKK